MPERQNDNHGIWKYDTVDPGSDLQMNPIAIRPPKLVESVGTDGRFLGAIRPFPGMADITIHGVPTPSGSTTIPLINGIEAVKYASIQKGTSGHTLKGLIYIAQNQLGTGKAVYFAYRDSQTGTSDVRMLEDLNVWDDFKTTTLLYYDVTSLGRYVYFVASADTTSTVTTVSGKEPPYNKAYFWDFKINTWDTFVVGFVGRFLGLLPERILGAAVNQDATAPVSSSTSAYQTVQEATTGGETYSLPAGNYTFGAQLISRKHNLRSYLRTHSKAPIQPASLLWRIFRTALLSGNRQITNTVGTDPAVAHAWGLSHWDGVKLYRGTADTVQDAILGSDTTNHYETIGNLFLQEPYVERHDGTSLRDDEQFDLYFGTETTDNTYMNDAALVTQEQYDVFLDEFGPAPRMKKIAAYDGILVGVTDPREPSTPSKDWQPNEQIPESIVWSSLTKREPENFPVANSYPLDDAGERVLALEPAGDYLFIITNSGIYRFTKSGGQISLNKIQFRLGGVSSNGATAIGNTLYVITRSGVKEVDGNSGSVRPVSVLDRLVIDNNEWANSITNVQVEYDAQVGALIFLNPTLRECAILWENTGAVTRLEDCPWSFLAGGPDVLTDGAQRCYFVTSTGTVNVIDAFRQMGKRTMCGTAAGETVNGTLSVGSGQTTLQDTTANFPANVVGFNVHLLSGNLAGQKATVTIRVSGTVLTVTGLSGTPDVGSRYSIAPIITRLTFSQLVGAGGAIDPFVAKKVSRMSVAFSNLANETSVTDTNAFVTMGVKRESTTLASSSVRMNIIPDKCTSYVNFRDTRVFPFIEFKGSNQDFQVQSVLIHGELTASEAQSRQG